MSERSLLIRKPLLVRNPLSIAVAVICTSLSANVLAQEEAQATDEQMVVTATRTEMALKQAPASMSVITAQDIEDSPGITLADIVAESTSVESDFDSTRAGRQMISIRGMDSDYTLIMVNGRRLSSASAIIRGNDFDLSTIPADSIERVEIIRGPMSALYGSDGMGGTINIITKAPENDWSTTINMDTSSPLDGDGGEEYSVGFTTSGALIDDELFARLSVNQTSRDGWQPYTGNGREDITALEERDTLSLLANLTWNATDNQTIDLDLGYSDDKRDGLAEYATGANPVDSKVVRNSQAITHSGFWSWGDTQVRYSRENVTDNDAADSDESYSSDVEELTQIVEASATTYLGESHTVTFGMDYQLSELTNKENLVNGTSEAYQGALFVQDQWLMTEQLTATVGGRLDKHELYGEEFSPRVYLVHQTTNDLIIKGGVGKAFKAPTLTQNQADYQVNSCKGACDLYGNEDLKPETSWNYEIAAIYSQPRWNVEGALFRNEINDLIDRDDTYCENGGMFESGKGCADSSSSTGYVKGKRTYTNVSEAVVQGAELTGQLQITDEWGVSGNYTFLDTEDKSTGEELLERYKHSGLVKLNWSPTYDLNTFISARYRGERNIETDLTQDAYTTLNIGGVYNINDSFRVRAGITNLTDEAVSQELENMGYVEEPRTYYVGMTADF
ncbi:TonB-dependent receptor domain-containing protein [Vibrio lentus]|uniref:Ligand-gated channel protein n=1 Tax=Vibrio lentus TaxID=136468 RepID=A0A2N7IK16_9VIBR|nr:TonB-dependent receptor [Vibrio lentus]PML57958.1 ligand-gated channel protein [Vibrio lentus]PMM19739.1 ligand-gated channel protein [Vibrio lentus]